MYNEEMKSKFIDICSTNDTVKKNLVRVFSFLEKEEKDKDRDFCTWTREEILSTLPKILKPKASGQKQQLILLRSYARWCKENGFAGVNEDIFNINEDDLPTGRIGTQMVANPQHLQRYLDLIFDPEEMETVDCTYRCFIWLAYMGIYEKELALKLRTSDVDLDRRIVTCNDIEYPIYNEAFLSIKKCKELNAFHKIHPNYKAKEVLNARTPCDLLLRGTKDNPEKINKEKFVTAILRASNKVKKMDDEYVKENKFNISISYDRMWLSGIFYRMYEGERAGIPTNFDSVAKYIILTHGYKGSRLQSEVGRSSRFLKIDYERWKKLYSV